MAFNYDINKTREAYDAVVSLTNGEAKQCIVDAYNVCKEFGSGLPMADDLKDNFNKLQAQFNDEFLENVKKVKANMEADMEYMETLSKTTASTTAVAGDMGTVKDSQAANAAKML